MVAVSPLLLTYSQEARAYELLTLSCSASFLLTVYALDRPSRRVLVGWAAVSTAALYTHYFAAFVVLPEVALLLWRSPVRRGVAVASGAVGSRGCGPAPAVPRPTLARHHQLDLGHSPRNAPPGPAISSPRESSWRRAQDSAL